MPTAAVGWRGSDMGDLSRHFSTHEFRCRCCGRAEINPRLVEALQALRDRPVPG